MITNHAEGTIESLRYNLGGDRPSQTTRLTLFPRRIHGARLEFKSEQGWYFTVGSTEASAPASKSPTYATHALPEPNARVQ